MELIELVTPVAIAISCHFQLFGLRCGITLVDNFSERPTGVVRAGGVVEFASQVPVQVFQLVDRSDLVSLPGRARCVGHAGHLLFKSAIGGDALGAGGSLRGVHDRRHLVFASTTHVGDRNRAVSWRGRVVDYHPSVARSSLAAGSRGDAAGLHRRRPRPTHGRP
jgi:hypothetical protein